MCECVVLLMNSAVKRYNLLWHYIRLYVEVHASVENCCVHMISELAYRAKSMRVATSLTVHKSRM